MQTKTKNQLQTPKRKVYEEKMKAWQLASCPKPQPPNQQRIKHEEHEEAGLVFIPMTADVHQQMRHLASMKRSPAIPFSN